MPLDLSDCWRDTVPTRLPSGRWLSKRADFAATVRPPGAQDLLALPVGLPADAVRGGLVPTLRGAGDVPWASGRAFGAAGRNTGPAAAAALSERGMESPSADLTCGECGHRWVAPVDIAGVLLRDVDAWARRYLDEVHRIASAYHWSERDILALSAARRQFYLEAIG